MSDSKAVTLLHHPQEKWLLLSIDEKTGKQFPVNLIAFGEDPDDPKATLIFTTTTPHVYQEMKLGIEFPVLKMIMERTNHFSVTNIEQSPAQIRPTSELGRLVIDFKTFIAMAMGPQPPSGMQ